MIKIKCFHLLCVTVVTVLGLAVTTGCQSEVGSAEGPAEGSDESKVEVRIAGDDAIQQLLDKHQGNVILIDYWATWCGPCTENFPHTVELSHKFADQGLSVVSISLDDPEQTEQVLTFLKEKKAIFENLISETGASDAAFKAFGIRGGVPFYQLYDRKGELRYRFSGDPTGIELAEELSQIEPRLKELLAETS